MAHSERDWLGTKEVAAYLEVSTRTLDGWAYKRMGPPHFKFSQIRRYRRSELEAWMRDHHHPGR